MRPTEWAFTDREALADTAKARSCFFEGTNYTAAAGRMKSKGPQRPGSRRRCPDRPGPSPSEGAGCRANPL